MSRADLLPCPFCGGDARKSGPTCRPEDEYDPSDRLYPVVECRKCYATALGADEDYRGDSAVAAWNRRNAHDALVEALEERVLRCQCKHDPIRFVADCSLCRKSLAALAAARGEETPVRECSYCRRMVRGTEGHAPDCTPEPIDPDSLRL